MSSQTSLATESARTAASQNTADYAASVAAHIAGDWGQHNQIAVYDQNFDTLALASGATYGAHTIPSAKCLRLLVTINDTNYALIMPGVPIGSYSGGGSDSGAPGALPPTFTTNPVSADLVAGSSVTLIVVVSGTQPILLQWTKNGVTIAGATSASYSVLDFQAADAGNYACVATNSVGQAISTTAVLSIRTTAVPTTPERPGVGGGI